MAEVPVKAWVHPSRITKISTAKGGWAACVLERAPRFVDEDLAYLCGLVSSDGYWGMMGDRQIQFVNTELALHERVEAILQSQFAYTPRRYLNAKHFDTVLPQGKTPKDLRDCYTTFINNRMLCDALRRLDSKVLELPRSLIGAWLRGVFDGDGCVRSNPAAPQIILSAWAPEANERIRGALLRVGIVTGRPPSAHAGREGNIVITGFEHLARFMKYVYSDHPNKRSKLDAVHASLCGRTSSSRLDSVPAGSLIRAARTSLGMGQRQFRRGNYVSQHERGIVAPSRQSLQSTVEEINEWREARDVPRSAEFEVLESLAESAVQWSRIQSIERKPSSEPICAWTGITISS
jgi:hypothetical protein